MTHLEFEQPLVELEEQIQHLKAMNDDGATASELLVLSERADQLRREIYEDLSTWQKVQLSRHTERPYFLDYLQMIFEDFVELHGDRSFRDDPAVVGGFARIDGSSVMVIGQQKGRTARERQFRNFGMAHPEGYRKAIRLMTLAERYRRPVVTFIDTPGAYPGIGAEERGQSEAIGQSILAMSKLTVPVIATVIGEGGSGGALALGVANRLFMLEYATYSVITPEGCASILWRDGAMAPEASEQLKLLAHEAKVHGIADEIVSEPLGGAHRDPASAAEALGRCLRRSLEELQEVPPDSLVAQRYQKFRSLGAMIEV
ncbi:MAG: acetyl-CoA carboxylase carboxyltransferase subunit alpha [Myxococcota bacterium]